jgi:hypothetical protein
MMTPEERMQFWQHTLEAARITDPRLIKAIAAALVLRHGRLITCEQGCHTFPVERITIEELANVVDGYNFGIRAPDVGILEVSAIDREYTSGHGNPHVD